MKPQILLITHSNDYYTIDKVKHWTQKLGGIPIRFNTDLYPAHISISNYFNHKKKGCQVITKENTFFTKNITSVWLRRIWQPTLPEELSPESKRICISESKKNLYNCLKLFEHAHWIDALHKTKEAENKLKQLKLAEELNIRIPATLISNNKTDIIDFFHNNNKKIITKLQQAISYNMSGEGASFKTSRVSEQDLIENEGMHLCPMIFQEEIEKQEEYRVIYVDGCFFTGGIKPFQSGEYLVDIKNTSQKMAKWFKADIPDDLKDKLHKLMSGLEITFGAIDVLKSVNNEYVFLEVNPVGEWGMLEKELDMPIAKHIALSLLKKSKSQ